MNASKVAMRCLVACDDCRRQFDVAGFATGSRFHCSCGRTLTVPEFRPQEAAVVRCSSCGAPRTAGSARCEHCRADWTAHERDMHTVCGTCMTIVSDRARFCHHCATPIVPQGAPGRPSSARCPACGKAQRLNSRDLGEPAVAVLECPACAGLWLSNEVFELLTERVRERAASVSSPAPAPATVARPRPGAPLYRRCPECDTRMNRRNFGRRSGVVLDVCRDHGRWFDARELEGVLGWIRAGGEARALERAADEARSAERRARFAVDWSRMAGESPDRREPAVDVVRVLRRLFDF